MNLHESLPDLSGLEQLRALIASGKRPPIITNASLEPRPEEKLNAARTH
jgi:hypothetical protein